MEAKKENTNTPAQQLLFHLQFMGIMAMSGREDESDAHYVKAQKIAQQLVDKGL